MCWFFFMGTSLTMMAQYNPDNPPEPSLKLPVTVDCEPAGVAWTSGEGSYQQGESVWINSSSQSSSYYFLYWTMNGKKLENTESGFNFTMGAEKVHLVAHYAFQPEDPLEPTLQERHRLYVKSQPEGCCSFNITNGEKVNEGFSQYISTYPKDGFKFEGWYEGASLISSYDGFYYEMPNKDVTLIAKFKYSPTNPDEPNGNPDNPQDDIQNQGKGDTNGDNKITVADAVATVNAYLSGNIQAYPLGIYDVNSDGAITIADAVAIINKYLGF